MPIFQPSYPRHTVCCFTGHRQLPPDAVPALKQALRRQIEQNIARGILHYFAGGALGFDMLAAEVVLEAADGGAPVTLHLALPALDYNKHWSHAQRRQLAALIRRAETAVYLAGQYDNNCMFRRNRYMVDHSGHCISYLTQSYGGTRRTVEYAEKEGLTVTNLAP